MSRTLVIRKLGLQSYLQTYVAMRQFTEQRDAHTNDEIWLLQHPAVYTQGKASLPEHFRCATDIPIVDTNRGGKVTYHAPGQLIGYCLINLKQRQMNIRQLVDFIEQSLLKLFMQNGIEGHLIDRQPGLYILGMKVASLGLRIHKGCSYHGFSLNVNMDLAPFSAIQPCGLVGMEMTQLLDHGCTKSIQQIESELAKILTETLVAFS